MAVSSIFLACLPRPKQSVSVASRAVDTKWQMIWRHLTIRIGLMALAFLLLSHCNPSVAQDHIVERAWLEDPQGKLQWPDVVQQPAHFYEGVLSRGFGTSVIWVRLRIDPQARPLARRYPEQLVLRIRPVYLDDIQVFDPLEPRGLAGVTGDWHHPQEQTLEGQDFMLPILRGDVPRDVWLRLSSTSTRQISVQALNMDELNRLIYHQQLLFSLYIGIIILFIAWGLVHWLFSREKIFGVFGLMQSVALFFALGSLGYTRVFWPDAWPAQWLDLVTSVCSILSVSSAIYFHFVLIREFDPPRWIVQLQRLLLALQPIKLVLLLAFDESILALHINMYEVLFAPALFWTSVWFSRIWREPAQSRSASLARPLVLGFYTVVLLTLALAALPGLAWIQGNEIPLYLVQAHGLFTAFLLMMMLQYRVHVRYRQQRETTMALERSQLQTQQERAIREDQAQLMAMLTHELKTPLATMHMRLDPDAQGSNAIKQAISEMNRVIERCLQTTQLDDRQLVLNREQTDLVKLVRDAVSSCTQPAQVQMHMPAQCIIQTDTQLLFIVLNNLLENACKYAAANSLIQLRMEVQDALSSGTSHVQIEIINLPGHAGWPDADKVFEKYYRSPQARRQAGTGLGLFLVRNLMQTLGGHVVYAPDSKHIRFVLQLAIQISDV